MRSSFAPADYAKDSPVDCGANGELFYSRWQANDCLNFARRCTRQRQPYPAHRRRQHLAILNVHAMPPFARSGNTVTCSSTDKGNTGVYDCAGGCTPSQACTTRTTSP
ncbi:MAG: hypothetical protein IH603_04405 [Burkholderia vietnamiensis]|nr:hypothetical protein [Burkholderia vietnamiensis]